MSRVLLMIKGRQGWKIVVDHLVHDATICADRGKFTAPPAYHVKGHQSGISCTNLTYYCRTSPTSLKRKTLPYGFGEWLLPAGMNL